MRYMVLAGLLFSLAAQSAWAAPWDGRRGGQEQGRPSQRDQAGPRRDAPPQERRMDRGDRRDGAMSDEERRALHRDLERANRELYRRR